MVSNIVTNLSRAQKLARSLVPQEESYFRSKGELIQLAVLIYLQAEKDPEVLIELIKRNRIRTHADTTQKNPLYPLAKLIFLDCNAMTVSRYAVAMLKALSMVKAGKVKPHKIADLVVQEGIGELYQPEREVQDEPNFTMGSARALLQQLTTLGFISARNSSVQVEQETLCIVQPDGNGKLRVVLLDDDKAELLKLLQKYRARIETKSAANG